MARKSPRKSAQQIAADLMARKRQDFGAVNLPEDAAELIRNADIEVTRAGQKRADQKVQEDSARRLDAFSALKDGMDKGAYDAARRLERDMLVRRGEGDRGAKTERVDEDTTAPAWVLKVVAAGQACDFIRARLSRRDWWLLSELIQPSVNRDGIRPKTKDAKGNVTLGPEQNDWRAQVFYVTGESHPNSQGAAVRAACTNLRDAYEELDVAPRKAA